MSKSPPRYPNICNICNRKLYRRRAHLLQEAALTRGMTDLSLRPKPADWLAVKTGESLARRRTSGTVSAQQDNAATLVRAQLAHSCGYEMLLC